MRVMLHNKQKPWTAWSIRCVNAEATSIESGLSYSGRSAGNRSAVRASAKEGTSVKAKKAMTVWCRQKSAEVVVLERYEPRQSGRAHNGRKD